MTPTWLFSIIHVVLYLFYLLSAITDFPWMNKMNQNDGHAWEKDLNDDYLDL